MDKKILSAKDIPVGNAIEWDIFDRDGRLLLKMGMKLQSPQQVSRLLQYGAYRIKDPEVEKAHEVKAIEQNQINEALSPFDSVSAVAYDLASIINQIIKAVADPKAEIQKRISSVSQSLISLCLYDLDATLGAIHLGRDFNYTILHPINTAVLCYIVGQQLNISEEKQLSLMSAALTSNIGMFSLQNELLDHENALTPDERKEIERHPMLSAVLLKHWGVNDRLWLETVLQHHEQKDGSGYPRKLSDERFILEARILGLADRYHALLSPRKYRKGLSPTAALSKLFKDRGKEVDEDVTLVFIREMGIYPPGTTVRLKNGETAIVTRRGNDRMKPMVKSILNERGIAYPLPIRRDSSKGLTEITGMCQPIKGFKPDFKELWDYKLKP